ncbi:MAG: NAD(+) diphosphatase [Phormidesmis sp. RL_2_1]|nr:NAD(+) diphosphatase [Phormidesmis sp. RL_2_1]
MTLSTLWFICDGSNLVVTGDCPTFPQAKTLESLGIAAVRTQFLGYLNGQPCVAAALSPAASLQGPFGLSHLRGLYGQVNEDLFAIAARAVQIVDWDRTHQYCGQCATPTIQLPTERAKRCPNCKLRQYPRLAPAVIMLISKGEEILLARAPRFRDGMYSVLAGFVEPGESLEETVTREVREEVSIEIQNIRYFGSQPWPFPNSLMVGFTAEYASGILTPEPSEIEDVAWFTKDNLPPVPGKLSIARKLIDWFIERQ